MARIGGNETGEPSDQSSAVIFNSLVRDSRKCIFFTEFCRYHMEIISVHWNFYALFSKCTVNPERKGVKRQRIQYFWRSTKDQCELLF